MLEPVIRDLDLSLHSSDQRKRTSKYNHFRNNYLRNKVENITDVQLKLQFLIKSEKHIENTVVGQWM